MTGYTNDFSESDEPIPYPIELKKKIIEFLGDFEPVQSALDKGEYNVIKWLYSINKNLRGEKAFELYEKCMNLSPADVIMGDIQRLEKQITDVAYLVKKVGRIHPDDPRLVEIEPVQNRRYELAVIVQNVSGGQKARDHGIPKITYREKHLEYVEG